MSKATDKENVVETEFTEEETKAQMLLNEEDIIQGLLTAAEYRSSEEEQQKIEIARNDKVLFAFSIRPLGEEEYTKCKKKHTKFVRNKQLGIKLQDDVDTAKYRADLIYTATIPKDRNQLWDNKKIWNSLNNSGHQIMNGLDVIEACLRSGEKDRVIDVIDSISGYESNLEEVSKNL